MKIYLVSDEKNPNIQSIVENSEKNNITLEFLSPQANSATYNEPLLRGDGIFLIPEGVDPFHFISVFIAEYRVLPPSLRNPILIDARAYDYIINEFFVKYRGNSPAVPEKEALAHYIMYKKKQEDFFAKFENFDDIKIFAESIKIDNEEKSSDITKIEETDKDVLRIMFDLEKIHTINDWEKIVNNHSKLKFFVAAAAFGKNWDTLCFDDEEAKRYNCLSTIQKPLGKKIYQMVGEIIAEMDGIMINGGPGDSLPTGPMRHSADAYLDKCGKNPLLAVYSLLVVRKYLKKEKVEGNYSKLKLAIAKTESERKEMMIKKADVIICLPGAIGTLAEIEEAFAFNANALVGVPKKTIFIIDPEMPRGNYVFAHYTQFIREKRARFHPSKNI